MLALAILVMAVAGPAPPGVGDPYDLEKATLYSNVCYVPEADDFVGLRVFLRPSGAAPEVVVQFAEGVFLDPVPARAQRHGQRLRFTVSEDRAPDRAYEGQFEGELLVLREIGPGADPGPIRLRRARLDARIQDCS